MPTRRSRAARFLGRSRHTSGWQAITGGTASSARLATRTFNYEWQRLFPPSSPFIRFLSLEFCVPPLAILDRRLERWLAPLTASNAQARNQFARHLRFAVSLLTLHSSAVPTPSNLVLLAPYWPNCAIGLNPMNKSDSNVRRRNSGKSRCHPPINSYHPSLALIRWVAPCGF